MDLSRFDGAEFVTYRTGDGLPDAWVTDCSRPGMARTGSRRMGAWPDSTLPDASHGTVGAWRNSLHSSSRRWHSRGRRHIARFASCWKIARAVSGREDGWALHAGPQRFCTHLPAGRPEPSRDGHVAGGECRRRAVDRDPGRPVHRLASGDVVPDPTAARAGVRHSRAGPGRRWSALGRPRRGVARAGTRSGGSTDRVLDVPPAARGCGAGPTPSTASTSDRQPTTPAP